MKGNAQAVYAEPGAARNECRAVLSGDSDGFLAALMRELDRSASGVTRYASL
jgi:hypothetical protein